MKAPKQKVALVTGGSSGIGLALAQELLSAGYRVIITARSTSVPDFNRPSLQVLQLDLSNQESIEAAGFALTKVSPELDLLINNAGVANDIHLDTPTYENLQQTIAINLTGTICFTELVLPLLTNDAQVINISSEMGLLAHAAKNAPAYRISKAGLNMYTKILAKRYADTNVTVLALHPGWVRTKLGGKDAPLTAEWSAKEIYKAIERKPATEQFINVYSKEQFSL